jgi:putative flippase GtrA
MDQPRRLDLARLWQDYGRRLVRYGGVTVVSTVVGLTSLFIGLYLFDWPGVFANFISVCMSTPPAYYLNRRFVWERGMGNHSASREVGPFWVMTIFGFIVSTLAIGIASLLTDVKAVLLLTQVASFGALWLLKFVFLEKYLWKDALHVHEPV